MVAFILDRNLWNCVPGSAEAQVYLVRALPSRARGRHVPAHAMRSQMHGTAAPSLLSHSTAVVGLVNTELYCMLLGHYIL